MDLRGFRLIHLAKARPSSSALIRELSKHPGLEPAFFLESCQRAIWITPSTAKIPEKAQGAGAGEVDLHEGQSAYEFLLRVALGLESQVRGETDIFGQLKEAWTLFAQGPSPWVPELVPWIQRIFEDTKEIRSRHFRDLGGSSYGSLVRKLLRQSSGQIDSGPVLLVGAGRIAAEVAPWLMEREIWILNRSKEKAVGLASNLLLRDPLARVRVLDSGKSEADAWRLARHAVICIPMFPAQDAEKIANWNASSLEQPRIVIHMGGLSTESGVWKELAGFHPLDHLFSLKESADGDRELRFARAVKDCSSRARLRFMAGSPGGGSICLPHGWEDLLAFA